MAASIVAVFAHLECNAADQDLSKWLMDLFVMIGTLSIAYFARSTDKAYHRIADIAAKLATIAQQQSEIIAARDEPIISARVESFAGNPPTDCITVSNFGPPISEMSVELAELFEITFWTPRPPQRREVKSLGTIGYYPGSHHTSSATDIIFETFPSQYRPLVIKIPVSVEKEFNGYRVLVDFKRYFRLEYFNRARARRTRWFSVGEFGSKEIADDEGRERFEIVRRSMALDQEFVFYKMNVDDFWLIVAQLAPSAIDTPKYQVVDATLAGLKRFILALFRGQQS